MDQKTLKKLLHYDPVSGIFTRLYGRERNQPAGSIENRGYRRIALKGKRYLASRLAFLYMTGSFPKHTADHINRNRSDDRWENLRDATYQMQNLNRSMKIGQHGKCIYKSCQKYRVNITRNNKEFQLGLYNTKEEAAAAYDVYIQQEQL